VNGAGKLDLAKKALKEAKKLAARALAASEGLGSNTETRYEGWRP